MALRGGSGGQEEEEEEDDGFGDSFAGFLDAIADSDDEGEGAGTRPKPFGAHRALPPSQPPVAGPPLDDSAAGGRLAAQARSPESAQPPHNEEQVLDGDGGERRAEEEEAFPSNFIQMPSRGLYGNDGGRVGDSEDQARACSNPELDRSPSCASLYLGSSLNIFTCSLYCSVCTES